MCEVEVPTTFYRRGQVGVTLPLTSVLFSRSSFILGFRELVYLSGVKPVPLGSIWNFCHGSTLSCPPVCSE